jgi:large conductance mechanosensitive channel
MEKKKKGFFGEFREFAVKGSVVDLAVGVIIGGAFATITSSLINDIIMPFAGLFLGGIDFSTWSFGIGPIFSGAEPSVINLGLFIQTVVNFLILALIIFIMVRQINKARARAAEKKKPKSRRRLLPAQLPSSCLPIYMAEIKRK